jgi:hypothetical protein
MSAGSASPPVPIHSAMSRSLGGALPAAFQVPTQTLQTPNVMVSRAVSDEPRHRTGSSGDHNTHLSSLVLMYCARSVSEVRRRSLYGALSRFASAVGPNVSEICYFFLLNKTAKIMSFFPPRLYVHVVYLKKSKYRYLFPIYPKKRFPFPPLGQES